MHGMTVARLIQELANVPEDAVILIESVQPDGYVGYVQNVDTLMSHANGMTTITITTD